MPKISPEALTIWLRPFRKRLHARDDVHDLEVRLPAGVDRLLACDQNHRHASREPIEARLSQIARISSHRICG